MKPHRTLAGELLAWALGALLVVWAGFVVVGYLTGEHEADELTDGHLASASALLLAYGGGASGRVPAGPPPGLKGESLKAHDYQQSLSVVLWDSSGRVLTRTGTAPLPPFALDEGFATLRLGDPPQAWRAFARWDPERQRRLMVLMSVAERDSLAADIAGQVSAPGLWLLPVVAIVLGLAIHRGLRPLRALARAVHALDIRQPQPLAVPTRHRELAVTVDAIHRLVERYQAALSRERALASELAHELRTPLAALALHTRAVREQGAAAEPRQLAVLEQEALRAGEVLAQLLALARADRAEFDEKAQPADVVAIARELVAEFAPAAHAGGRDLGLRAEGDSLVVPGHALLLRLALRNLVENALHHTPAGTHVEVQVDARGRWVQVVDEPPAGGARPASHEDGALGLGLGHRVVEKIAAIHGARFERPPHPGRGTCWRIAFAPD